MLQLPPRKPVPGSKRSIRRHGANLLRIGADIITLALSSAAALVTDGDNPLTLASVAGFSALSLLVLNAARLHGVRERIRLEILEDARHIVTSTAIAGMATLFALTVLTTTEPSAHDIVRLWAFSAGLLTIVHSASIALVHRRRRTAVGGMRALIHGTGQVGRLTAYRLLAAPELGIHPIGFIDKEPGDDGRLPVPVLGASWNLEQLVREHEIDCVVIAFSTAPHDVLLSLLDECARLRVRALVVPRLFERVPSRVEVTHVGALPLLELMPTSTKSVQYAIKYALDRVVAALMLIVLAPFLLAISGAVLISMGRPVLYRQERVGRDRRRFEMLKFRSMRNCVAADEHHVVFDTETAPGGVEGADRRTRVGSFLRRTSLDELAQLINVLKGEMSLVGPRPERPEFVAFFGENVRRYDARHRVKSGVTGWAQVHRLRGKTSIADRVEWDNYYIENFSLWLDVKILLRTIPEALRSSSE